MPIHLTDDIRTVTELKRKTREILRQVHETRRPVVVTVNGKADAVLAASVFHFGEIYIPDLKLFLKDNRIPVRL